MPIPALAIVNLEDVHTRDFEEGFNGALGVDLSGASGNSDEGTILLSTQLHWKKASRSNILLANYSYGKANGQINTDKAFFHLRHIQSIDPNYAWELFTQLQNDRFARLSLRSLLGGGVRYKLVQEENRYIFGVGSFYERDRLSKTSSALNEPSTHLDWRANLYLIVGHNLNKQSHLYSTLYYQPTLGDIGDYHVLLQGGVKIKMTDNLKLHMGVNARYDSQPPTAVEDYDINYRSGLEYHF